MDIEVLLESFDGAFATNTLRDYRKADNGRYQTISHAHLGRTPMPPPFSTNCKAVAKYV